MNKQQQPASLIRFLQIFAFSFGLWLIIGTNVPPVQAFHFPWDQGHDTTDWKDPIEPGTCKGPNCDPCKATGSPVYIPTGHFVWSETDIILAGRPQISITRSYNSNDPHQGIFGNGWSSNCEPLLVKVRNGDGTNSYILRISNGKRYEYKQVADGSIKAPPGRFDTIQGLGDANGSIRLVNQNGAYQEFNASGRITKWVDPDGISKNYEYDENGNITKISSGARSLTLIYSSNGRVFRIHDHIGRTWTYNYDDAGNLINITDPLGGTRIFEYQAYSGEADSFVYSQLTKIVDESGVIVTEVSYNKDRVASYTAGPNIYRYSYNTSTKTVTKTDNASRTRRYVYNDEQVITAKTDPLGQTAYFEYNANGKLINFTDKLGNKWISTYDEKGRRISSITPTGRVSSWEYTGDSPKPTKIVTPSGSTSIIEYDANLNPVGVTDARGNKSRLVFDETGNITATIDALGSQINFEYNDLGLPTKITDPKNNITSFSYDNLARKTSFTDAEGRTTTYEYDELDRLVKTVNALGHEIRYSYDAAGRVLAFTDPVGNITAYSYDQYGQLSRETRPDGRENVYTYDHTGLLVSINRFDGKIVRLSYDTAERLIGTNVDNDAITYEYNARGDLTRVSNTTGSIIYTYNSDGEVTAENQNNVQISRQYNADGALTQLSALGRNYIYNRNELNKISSLSDGTDTFSFLYDANSALTAVNLPNGLSETYTYDQVYNVTNINTGSHSLSYTHDRTDLITQKVRDGSAAIYAYDEITRLIRADATTYNYDVAGNNLNNGAVYNPQTNQILENDVYTFTYDASGNLKTKTRKDGTQTKQYTFNARNQLVRVETLGGVAAQNTLEFSYDAIGRRFSKTQNGIAKRYVYDGSNIFAVLDGFNAPLSFITQSDGIDAPLSISSAGSSYYYHRNHQRSIVALTDAAGNQTEELTYNPYGVTTKTALVDTGNPYGYTGREYDDDDLYYYRARYYDPKSQSFISEDPIYLAAGDYNYYRYVVNDPVNQTDSSGLILDTIADAGFILYDLYRIVKDNVINGCDNLGENLAALGADVAGALIPFASGGGMAVRAARYGDDVADATRRCPGGICTNGMCFIAGTPVHTKDGLKAIEDIQVGDLVASRDEKSGETAWKSVVDLIRNHDKDILSLTLVDAEGVEETFGVTPEHPFWVEGKEWVEAGHLKIGMQVVTIEDNKKLTVKSIEKDELKQSTYNFEVEDFHTYFVGNTGVWVHNACDDASKVLPKRADDLLKQGYKETSHPNAAEAGHRTFENSTTGDKIRFDQGKPGKPGFEGQDHYHRYNPNATGKKDLYLDKNGNPCPRGCDASHLFPGD